MHIFILGGNSVRNKQWAYHLQEVLAPLADSVKVHEYAHWSSGEEFIDLDTELKALTSVLSKTDTYLLVAKSMGSVLAAKGMYQKALKPVACILMGIPLQVISSQQISFKDWLPAATCKLVCIQNEHDPLGSFTDVRTYLHETPGDYQLHMLPGETHDYSTFDELKRIVASEIRALHNYV